MNSYSGDQSHMEISCITGKNCQTVKMATHENGESKNGNKLNYECVCVDLNAVNVTIVTYIHHRR